MNPQRRAMMARGKSQADLAMMATACFSEAMYHWLQGEMEIARMYLEAGREWRECLKASVDEGN